MSYHQDNVSVAVVSLLLNNHAKIVAREVLDVMTVLMMMVKKELWTTMQLSLLVQPVITRLITSFQVSCVYFVP